MPIQLGDEITKYVKFHVIDQLKATIIRSPIKLALGASGPRMKNKPVATEAQLKEYDSKSLIRNFSVNIERMPSSAIEKSPVVEREVKPEVEAGTSSGANLMFKLTVYSDSSCNVINFYVNKLKFRSLQ